VHIIFWKTAGNCDTFGEQVVDFFVLICFRTGKDMYLSDYYFGELLKDRLCDAEYRMRRIQVFIPQPKPHFHASASQCFPSRTCAPLQRLFGFRTSSSTNHERVVAVLLVCKTGERCRTWGGDFVISILMQARRREDIRTIESFFW
jgi:hypothetical protein